MLLADGIPADRIVRVHSGIDLDSVLTILPNGNALVGDINLGIAVARDADWSVVQREYKFKEEPTQSVIDAQSAPNVVALQRFLDEVAAELQRDGMTVRRLPLLNIPASLTAQEGVSPDFEFLMTWNNGVDKEDQIQYSKARDTRRVFVAHSADDGLTWTKPN